MADIIIPDSEDSEAPPIIKTKKKKKGTGGFGAGLLEPVTSLVKGITNREPGIDTSGFDFNKFKPVKKPTTDTRSISRKLAEDAIGITGFPIQSAEEAYKQGNYPKIAGQVLSSGALLALGGKLLHGSEVPPEVEAAAPKPQLALPGIKPRLALPPAPDNLPVEAPKPSFIAGPGEVAENRPYSIDTGASNPRIGAKDQGTVLPSEFGQTVSIPPDLAARTVKPVGHVMTDAERAQSALVPDRFKTPTQLQSDIVQPKDVAFTGAGNARPGEPQLSSAPPKIKNNPVRATGGESTLINPGRATTLTGNVERLNSVGPPTITPDLKPTEAVQRWGWGRNAGKVAASEIKNQFSDLADKPELVGAFQRGDRTGSLKNVSTYFDDRFKKLVDAGVLDPEQYKQNYLKQLWENTPEEVNAVFNKSGIAKEPGLSKESVFKSYDDGIKAGLTPKYNNIADIAGAFEKEFHNALRDKELYDYFTKNKMLDSDKKLTSPFEWRLKGEGTKDAAGMISNYFSKSPEGLNKVANFVTGTKNLALTQGLPFRTGQISAHGINVMTSDIMAQGFKKGLGDFFKGSIDPNVDVQFVKENTPLVKKLVANGMNWSDIEDHSALGDKAKTTIDRIPGVSQANELRRKVFEDPLFKVHLPATKLRIAMDRYKELIPKIGEDSALKAAASYANDFAGGVDKTFRNKTYQDLARIGLLAPDWLESRANIVKGLVTGKSGYVKAGARGAAIAAVPVVSGIASKGVSEYLASKPSEASGVHVGDSEGKNREIEPLGTSVEPQRAALQIGTQLSQGNLQFPFRYAGNKLSPPLQTVERLHQNVDPYGNPLSGKDRFGRPISGADAAMNIGQEFTRPITPSLISALIDYYRGKAPGEEVISKSLGLPVTYTSEPKAKKSSGGLKRLR